MQVERLTEFSISFRAWIRWFASTVFLSVGYFTCCTLICTSYDDPEKLVSLIIDKLKNLSIQDFNKEISMATIKSYKSDCIRALDSISYIGDETLSLAIEGPGYDEEKRVLLSTTEDDLLAYIPYVKESKITYLIALPKNVGKSK